MTDSKSASCPFQTLILTPLSSEALELQIHIVLDKSFNLYLLGMVHMQWSRVWQHFQGLQYPLLLHTDAYISTL